MHLDPDPLVRGTDPHQNVTDPKYWFEDQRDKYLNNNDEICLPFYINKFANLVDPAKRRHIHGLSPHCTLAPDSATTNRLVNIYSTISLSDRNSRLLLRTKCTTYEML